MARRNLVYLIADYRSLISVVADCCCDGLWLALLGKTLAERGRCASHGRAIRGRIVVTLLGTRIERLANDALLISGRFVCQTDGIFD